MLYHPLFLTVTCHRWLKLLNNDKYKLIVIDSLKYLVESKQVKLYAYVLMPNHLHLIWQIRTEASKDRIQHRFLKFTAHQIKKDLRINHPKELSKFFVNSADRKYQIWQRNSLSIELSYEDIFMQKLEYIHLNPVKKGLCDFPEEYRYSSAKFYIDGVDEFSFLTDFRE